VKAREYTSCPLTPTCPHTGGLALPWARRKSPPWDGVSSEIVQANKKKLSALVSKQAVPIFTACSLLAAVLPVFSSWSLSRPLRARPPHGLLHLPHASPVVVVAPTPQNQPYTHLIPSIGHDAELAGLASYLRKCENMATGGCGRHGRHITVGRRG
jgi:hypothetical protein